MTRTLLPVKIDLRTAARVMSAFAVAMNLAELGRRRQPIDTRPRSSEQYGCRRWHVALASLSASTAQAIYCLANFLPREFFRSPTQGPLLDYAIWCFQPARIAKRVDADCPGPATNR